MKNSVHKHRSVGGALFLSVLIFSGCQNTNSPAPSKEALEQLTACKINLRDLGTAMEMYALDWSGHYPEDFATLTPNYLRTIPECEVSGVPYRVHFGPDALGNRQEDPLEHYYYLECYGENHTAAGVSGNFPAYNVLVGLMTEPPSDDESDHEDQADPAP